MKKIVIIGGGASGMAAAIAAAQKNKEANVCILEHKDSLGKKLLSTGNGRCNFTNEVMESWCYYSDNPEKIPQILQKFNTKDTLKFFGELGIIPKSRNGYYYPRSDQARAILDVLKLRLGQLGVEVHTGIHVKEIVRKKSGFQIHICSEKDRMKMMEATQVIVTTGAKAASVLGSDGSGYNLAKSFGHSIVPVVPALVQLRVKNHSLAKAVGVRTEAKVSIFENEKLMGTDTGELQITAYGISGIPVFQVSRHAAKALYYKRQVCSEIDFMPDISDEALLSMLQTRKKGRENLSVSEFLIGIFNHKLIPCILKCTGIRMQLKVSELNDNKLKALVHTCKHLSMEIENTNGFENAQVCAGGIRLTEINTATMESLYCEGLYFAGEILDADGICGGYNLQWAWASGYIAGESAADALI